MKNANDLNLPNLCQDILQVEQEGMLLIERAKNPLLLDLHPFRIIKTIFLTLGQFLMNERDFKILELFGQAKNIVHESNL